MATVPVFLPGKISRTEEPGRPQFTGLQRIEHNWGTKHARVRTHTHTHTHTHTPVSLSDKQTINKHLLYLTVSLILLGYLYMIPLAPQALSLPTAAAKLLQSCPTLCDPIDGSPPGSSIPGILQARTWSGLPFPSPLSLPSFSFLPTFPLFRRILLML